jgi:hypothetical protein
MGNSILDKRVQPGMVYTSGSGGSGLFVVKRISEDEITSVEIGENCEYSDGPRVHWSGFGWFRPGSFEFVRQMGIREFNRLFKTPQEKLTREEIVRDATKSKEGIAERWLSENPITHPLSDYFKKVFIEAYNMGESIINI